MEKHYYLCRRRCKFEKFSKYWKIVPSKPDETGNLHRLQCFYYNVRILHLTLKVRKGRVKKSVRSVSEETSA